MNEEMVQQLMATAERLATAAESLDRVLGRLDAQQEALNAKVDRIVAAVDETASHPTEDAESSRRLQEHVAELEKSNSDLTGPGDVARGLGLSSMPAAGAPAAQDGKAAQTASARAFSASFIARKPRCTVRPTRLPSDGPIKPPNSSPLSTTQLAGPRASISM